MSVFMNNCYNFAKFASITIFGSLMCPIYLFSCMLKIRLCFRISVVTIFESAWKENKKLSRLFKGHTSGMTWHQLLQILVCNFLYHLHSKSGFVQTKDHGAKHEPNFLHCSISLLCMPYLHVWLEDDDQHNAGVVKSWMLSFQPPKKWSYSSQY